jgi:hypothetical protein
MTIIRAIAGFTTRVWGDIDYLGVHAVHGTNVFITLGALAAAVATIVVLNRRDG